jgi:excisionase family DNA binding protein
MLHKNIDRDTLAATIAQAVIAALTNLEPEQPPAPTRETRTITALEFSRETGIGLSRVRQFLNSGKIKFVRSGRYVLIPRAELTDFFERESIGGEK